MCSADNQAHISMFCLGYVQCRQVRPISVCSVSGMCSADKSGPYQSVLSRVCAVQTSQDHISLFCLGYVQCRQVRPISVCSVSGMCSADKSGPFQSVLSRVCAVQTIQAHISLFCLGYVQCRQVRPISVCSVGYVQCRRQVSLFCLGYVQCRQVRPISVCSVSGMCSADKSGPYQSVLSRVSEVWHSQSPGYARLDCGVDCRCVGKQHMQMHTLKPSLNSETFFLLSLVLA